MSRRNNGTDGNYLSGTFSSGVNLSGVHTLSIFCWIKKTDWGTVADHFLAFGMPITEAATTSNIYSIGHLGIADRVIGSSFSSGGNATNTSETASSPDEANGIWVPVLYTIQRSAGPAYVRKVHWLYPRESSADDTAASSLNATSADEIYIGGRWVGDGASMDARIAEIAIWYGRALSSSDFDYLVTDSQSGRSPALLYPDEIIGYWSFSTSSLADGSGNGGPTLTESGTFSYDPDHPSIIYTEGTTLTPNPAGLSV